MRRFEKISYEQFKKDIHGSDTLYQAYALPTRATKCSAAYDFKTIQALEILPGETKNIPTGVKAQMNDDEVLMVVVRSSMGFHYNIRLVNQVGIIDGDYYNNSDNEGHIWIKLQNEGTIPFRIEAGVGIAQGMFTKFLTVDHEEFQEKNIRTGGFGSTNKEEK